MIQDVRELRSILLQSGIAAEADLHGCSAEEIAVLERRHGPLPASYRQVLALLGRGAGQLVDSQEFWIYADQIGRIREQVQSYLQEVREKGGARPDVPANAFFISARYGERPHFVLTGDAPDSAVHVFDYDDGSVRPAFPSVWAWIEAFVQDTRFFLDRGIPRSNPRRRGPDAQP